MALVGNEKYDKDTLVWKLKRIGRTMGNNEEGRIPPAAYASADLAFNLNLPSANNVNNEAVEFLKGDTTSQHAELSCKCFYGAQY